MVEESRAARLMTWIAFAMVLLLDAAYLGLMFDRSDRELAEVTVLFVGAYMGLMAAMLGVSSLPRLATIALRTPLRAGAAGGLLVLGVVAIFSIGLPIVIAGALATGAAIRTASRPNRMRAALSGVAAVVVAIAVLVAGFEVSIRIVICPSFGMIAGSSSGFVTSGVHYECINGRLSLHEGQCSSGSVSSDGTVTSNC